MDQTPVKIKIGKALRRITSSIDLYNSRGRKSDNQGESNSKTCTRKRKHSKNDVLILPNAVNKYSVNCKLLCKLIFDLQLRT